MGGLTQMELNVCASDEAGQSDSLLGRVYGLAIESARGRGPAHEEALRAAQQAWISFRDRACEAEGQTVGGGGMQPMVIAMCWTRTARARINDLNAYLDRSDH
jgi:uncharacterized protein YecT (DUF1311 family)